MKTAFTAGAGWIAGALLGAVLLVSPAFAQDRAALMATEGDGYARLVLRFADRLDLPEHSIRIDNNVLSVEFDDPVDVAIPDVGALVEDYVSLARVDPDGGGLRVGLRRPYNFNSIEAGERLFIDLMPEDWSGLPPGLPQEVIDELAERARLAAIEAERERKARGAEDLDPQVDVRLGRNPSFLRLQFGWTVETDAKFSQEEDIGEVTFEWPVPVDLREARMDLPAEIVSMESAVTPDGTRVTLQFAEGVQPRFYQVSPTRQVLDIDLDGINLPQITPAELNEQVAEQAEPAAVEKVIEPEDVLRADPKAEIVPFATSVGATVRLVFPFEQDVPAAVFRRGDTLWLIFDTAARIEQPDRDAALEGIAETFETVPSGDTQIVRIELAQDRLATLGSEGRAWVLSLGDIVLSPTTPVRLERQVDEDGFYKMTADLGRPGRVHMFRDPDVGDELRVVTAYPPARGVSRKLGFVDFEALRSVHGLVIRPRNTALDVGIENGNALVEAPGGLTVSSIEQARAQFFGSGPADRGSFVALADWTSSGPPAFRDRRLGLEEAAAAAGDAERNRARLDLATFLMANHYAHEALGVLDVLDSDLDDESLIRQVRVASAIASTMAHRPQDALRILNSQMFSEDVDALVWRTLARVEAADYLGARQDAALAVVAIGDYPGWVRREFDLAHLRAAIETGAAREAEAILERIDTTELSFEQLTLAQLLSGRLDELRGRLQEALDSYGQVIATDVRPTRAEAVYRTLKVLDEQGRLDLERAADTLAAEAMLWRGGRLEVEMVNMLADIYFRAGEFRQGFEAVRQAAEHHPGNGTIETLQDNAQDMFARLFLDGRAAALEPVEALALYYDFRQLTPPGARGDEMIRNLARRLVDVDLLDSAAELLAYQLDNRLTGVARAQLAADLAVIYLADRRPQRALAVLNDTRLPNLSGSLSRQRRVLEARALIDGGRYDLALDMLRDQNGRDVELMRIDADWAAGRHSRAAEAIEAMYASDDQLDERGRMAIVKAAVGYVLEHDSFGLSRLRDKFGERMVSAPEWAMFDFVTSPIKVSSLEFMHVARQVAAIDSVEAFLDSYRAVYADRGALTPSNASVADGRLADASR